jgi:hypothetical protein
MTTSLPTKVPAAPSVTCSTDRSWTFERAPTRTAPTSPRNTAPNHTLA